MIVFPTFDLDRPIGGQKVVFDMVDVLVEHGYEAAVWFGEPGFRPTWFTSTTPLVHGSHFRLRAGDLLVVPEIGGAAYQPHTRHARVVVLNQSHFLTFDGFYSVPVNGVYPGWPNAVAAIVGSEVSERFVRSAVTDESFPVHRFVIDVGDEFRPGRGNERVISMVTHRRPIDVNAVHHLLARRAEIAEHWQIRLLEGLTRTDLASALGTSAVFVATAERDGFGLPAAEAMASGCRVVGFTGGGGADYMIEPHAVVLHDSDLVGVVEAVLSEVRRFDERPAEFARLTTEASRFIKRRYNRERFARSVIEAFEALIPIAGQQHPVTIPHYSAISKPRTAWERAYVGVRSAAGGLKRRLGR